MFPIYGTSRIVAGGPFKGSIFKCELKPVGKAIAERAKEAGVTQVSFDRSGSRYHGRVKALAEAARLANYAGGIVVMKLGTATVSRSELRQAVLRDAAGAVVGGAETFRDLSEVEALRRELAGRYRIGDIVSRSPLMDRLFRVLPAIAVGAALSNGNRSP